MGYSSVQVNRAIAYIDSCKDRRVQTVDRMSFVGLQCLAKITGSSPPSGIADMPATRKDILKCCKADSLHAFLTAQFCCSITLADFKFLKGCIDLPGPMSLLQCTKSLQSTVALVIDALAYHDTANGSISRQVGFHAYDLDLEKCVWVRLSDVKVLMPFSADIPSQNAPWKVPEELCWIPDRSTCFAKSAVLDTFLQARGLAPQRLREKKLQQVFNIMAEDCMTHTEASLQGDTAGPDRSDPGTSASASKPALAPADADEAAKSVDVAEVPWLLLS
jgi:hypothetical protein